MHGGQNLRTVDATTVISNSIVITKRNRACFHLRKCQKKFYIRRRKWNGKAKPRNGEVSAMPAITKIALTALEINDKFLRSCSIKYFVVLFLRHKILAKRNCFKK